MIQPIGQKSIEERLDLILDKINKSTVKSLDSDEIKFLDSFSIGKESDVNNDLNKKECNSTFISDDGLFMFFYTKHLYEGNNLFIYGKIIVPDITKKDKTIKGELTGDILVLNDGTISLSFKKNKYDLFDFVSGLEYELDCFIDEVVDIIKEYAKDY